MSAENEKTTKVTGRELDSAVSSTAAAVEAVLAAYADHEAAKEALAGVNAAIRSKSTSSSQMRELAAKRAEATALIEANAERVKDRQADLTNARAAERTAEIVHRGALRAAALDKARSRNAAEIAAFREAAVRFFRSATEVDRLRQEVAGHDRAIRMLTSDKRPLPMLESYGLELGAFESLIQGHLRVERHGFADRLFMEAFDQVRTEISRGDRTSEAATAARTN